MRKKCKTRVVSFVGIALLAVAMLFSMSCGGGDDPVPEPDPIPNPDPTPEPTPEPTPDTAPVITTASLLGGSIGLQYSQTLAATGSTATWTIETGALPAGLSLSANGAITGTPTAAGTANFTVKATNSAGSDTKALSIAVANPDYSVTVAAVTNGTITVNPSTAKFGSTVTITIASDYSYMLKSISAKRDDTNAAISLSGVGLTRTFTMPASNVTISGEFDEIPGDTVVVNFEGIHYENVELDYLFTNNGTYLEINYNGPGAIDTAYINGQFIENYIYYVYINWEDDSVSFPYDLLSPGVYNIAIIIKVNGIPYSKEIRFKVSAY